MMRLAKTGLLAAFFVTSVAWSINNPSGDIQPSGGSGGGGGPGNSNITFPLVGPAGSAAAPTFAVGTGANSGIFYDVSKSAVALTSGGAESIYLTGTSATFPGAVNASSLVCGPLSGNTLTLTGSLNGTNATYSGSVGASSVTATSLSASTETLTGALTGATASFSGNVGAPSASIGTLTVTGPLNANSATVTGVLNANTLSANSVNAGTATLTGALGAATANVTGNLTVGSLSSGALNATTGTFTGALNGTSATLTGVASAQSLTATTSVSGATGTFSGALGANSANITGALNANTVTATGNFAGPNFGLNGINAASLAAAPRPSKPIEYFVDNFQAINAYAASVYLSSNSANAIYQMTGGLTATGSGNNAGSLTTGATATGQSNAQLGYNSFMALYNAVHVRVGFWLPVLSNGTNTYSAFVGSFQTTNGAPQGYPLAYLKYTDSVNSGKFQMCGGTCVDTGVTVTAGTYYIVDYLVTITPNTTSSTLPVTWAVYAGGATTAAGSGTANIGQATLPGGGAPSAVLAAAIMKSVGTTAVLLNLDFWEYYASYP